MTKAQMLRKLFKEKNVLKVAGAHDGLSAKLVEKNDFDAIWASGFEIATSFAVPDANILTMSQNLERACEMNDSTNIPIIADCDTGYGNSNNVIHMVKQYEAAGVAAVCIEDKKFPKVNSFVGDRQDLASIAEFVGKIMAAKSTQASKDFMVIARVEALIAGKTVSEAIERAKAYVNAGADAILIHSREKDQKQIIDFCKEWQKRAPLVIVPTVYPDFSDDKLKELGIKVVIYANHGMRAAIQATDKALAYIRKNGKDGIEKEIAPMDFLFRLQNMDRMKENEQAYLKSDHEDVDVVIVAAGEPTYQKDMKHLLKDVPPVMLDINGKSLLQRNVEALKSLGIRNISVVSGYNGEKINLKGINKIANKEYKESYILDSMMKAQKYLNNRVLFCYGDVMFDKSLIEALLKRQDDITLAVDPSFKKSDIKNHTLDLVKTKRPSEILRSIEKKVNPIVEISTQIDKKSADYEFIGVALFSKKGFEDFKREYDSAKKAYKNKKFQTAASFKKASFTNMINEMVQKGNFINTMEVHSGWIEIHTFDNYKLACSLVA